MFKDRKNHNKLTIRKDAIAKLLTTFDEKFKIVIFPEKKDLLGSGSFGKCYLGILKKNELEQKSSHQNRNSLIQSCRHKLVVVKQIKKNKRDFTQQQIYKKQIQLLSLATRISHSQKNLVYCYPYTFSSQSNYYMVMQYCANKSLNRLINKRKIQFKKFHFCQFLKIFNDLINGYYYLNKCNILHEDLKPDNIFIHGKQFKIGDFGLGLLMDRQNKYGRGGTQAYNPMEKYLNQTNLTHKSDIYAIGIIMYQIFYGVHPYYTKAQKRQYEDKQFQKLKFQKNKQSGFLLVNKPIEFTRKQKNIIFINFYNMRTIKKRQSRVKLPEQKQVQNYKQILQIYDKIPALLQKMIQKDVNARSSYTQVLNFFKQQRVQQKLQIIQYHQKSRNYPNYFPQLSLQSQVQIQLPQFSSLSSQLTIQQQSSIHQQSISLQNSIISHQSSLSSRIQKSLEQQYPQLNNLKMFIQKVNGVVEFGLQVYQMLMMWSFGIRIERDRFSQDQQDDTNQIAFYQDKKIQLSFAIQKYLLAFIINVQQRIDNTLKGFNQDQLKKYYHYDIDAQAKTISKHQQLIRSTLFVMQKDIQSFQQNQQNLQNVIIQDFFKTIGGLDYKNYIPVYLCLTILKIKDQIHELVKNSKNFIDHQVKLLINQWNQLKVICQIHKSLPNDLQLSKKLKELVHQQLKSKKIQLIIFID